MTPRMAMSRPMAAGLAIRLVLLTAAVPLSWSHWFLPFLQDGPMLDPWSAHAAADPAAWPYGIVMYAFHGAAVWIAEVLTALGGADVGPRIGLGISVLAADLALLALLHRLAPGEHGRVDELYWLSPIVIVVGYWHGQLDFLPVLLLTAGLAALRFGRPDWAGLTLAGAVSAKFSMALAVPFVAVYLFRAVDGRVALWMFLRWFAASTAALYAVALASPGYREMVFGTEQLSRLLAAPVRLGDGHLLYAYPFAYALALYGFFRLRRTSFALLLGMLGIVFAGLLIVAAAPPGWYIWVIPFLVLITAEARRTRLLQASAALIAAYHVAYATGVRLPWAGLEVSAPLSGIDFGPVPAAVASDLALTGISATLAIMTWWLWTETVARSDIYRLSRAPLALGIAGDSGVGKDTLSAALSSLFTARPVTTVSGDDYHKYERGAAMWRALTHLDPKANDLEALQRDVMALLDGRSVLARHYDHASGRFTRARAVPGSDIVIVSGLHVLMLPALRERFDVSIFLDMDEDLRRAFKISRDVGERGHSQAAVMKSIERREADGRRWIRPQLAHADIVFRLAPLDREDLARPGTHPARIRLRLDVVLRDSIGHETLSSLLVGLCGLDVESAYDPETGHLQLSINGDVSADDIAMATTCMPLSVRDLLAPTAAWAGGQLGLMQLITLVVIDRNLRRRGT